MADEIKIKISPIMDTAEFNKAKKQLEELGKIAAQSKDPSVAAGMGRAKAAMDKAESSYKRGSNGAGNKSIMEVFHNINTVVGKLQTTAPALQKKLVELSEVFVTKSKELEARTKALNKLKAQVTDEKKTSIAAYAQLAAGKNAIKYTGKGTKGGYVKSEAGLVQTLYANQLSTKPEQFQSIKDFAAQNKINTKGINLDNTNYAVLAQQVAERFTEKLVKELNKSIDKESIALEKFTQELEENAQQVTSTADAWKKADPNAVPGINAQQTGFGAAVKMSGLKVQQAVVEGTQEGVTKSTEDAIEAQKQLAVANNNTANSFRKSILGATAYGLAVRQLRRWISQAVSTIKEIDQALTTQAMVSGMTRKETYGLLKSYQQLADQCGATTTEVAQVATAYFRQGKTAQEALTLTKTAVTAAKVAGISTAESVDYLTTAVNGFNLSAKDAMRVSDKFAALAATAAVSYDELATALSKVASQANLAGMSMDYTLALLTKGIETTRESAESIGTALKTVLARMREISDYGATLEDGVSLNNVETQLAYVNISLRDNSGELRNTEAVLDELGKKWSSLSSNQQAAIAKALAGTRQQSRLIAMMSDYERTTELAVIAQQSLGATQAQAAEYLQGMEAATNRVTTAYQHLITAVTSSDAIISIVNTIGDVLNNIADFLSTDAGIGFAIATIVGMGATMLSNWIAQKIELFAINKQQKLQEAQQKLLLEQEKQAIALEARKTLQAKMAVAQKELESKKENVRAKAAYKSSLQEQKEALKLKKIKQGLNAEEEAQLRTIDARIGKADKALKSAQAEEAVAQENINTINKEIAANDAQLKQYDELTQSVNKLSSTSATFWDTMNSAAKNALSSLIPFVSIFTTINSLKQKGILLTKKQKQEDEQATVAASEKAAAESAAGAATSGLWPVALTILAALGIAAAVAGVAALAGSFSTKEQKNQKAIDETREKVNKLSQDTFNLNKSAQTIDQLGTKFLSLNEKIVKSKEELEEFNDIIQKLKEEGLTDDDIDAIKTGGIAKLTEISDKKRAEAAKLSQDRIIEQTKLVNQAREQMKLASTEDAKKQAERDYQDALNDLAEMRLSGIKQDIQRYAKQKGLTTEDQSALNNFLSLVGTTAFEQGGELTLDSNGNYVFGDEAENFIEAFKNNSALMGDLQTVLNTSTNDWSEYEAAWNNIAQAAAGAGITLNKVLPQVQDTLLLMNKYPALKESGLTLNEISTLTNIEGFNINYFTKGINETEEEGYLKGKKFGQGYTAGIKDSKVAQEVMDALYPNLAERDQNIKNLQNNYKDVVESVSKYLSGEISAQELGENFANAGIFNEEALEAAFQGNYGKLYKILGAQTNEEIKEDLARQIKDYNNVIALLEQEIPNLTGAELEAAQARLTSYKAELKIVEGQQQAVEKLNEVSLKAMHDAQKEAISKEKELQDKRREIYRQYQEAIFEEQKKALEKERDMYQEYFDDIDKALQDDDYEQKRNKIVTNIGALGASTDAASLKAFAELEKQLTELDKEREETLRQRTRDALFNNIDKTIENIDKNIEALTKNSEIDKEVAKLNDSDLIKYAVATTEKSGEDTGIDKLQRFIEVAESLGLNPMQLINDTFDELVASGAIKKEKDFANATSLDTTYNNGNLVLTLYGVNGETEEVVKQAVKGEDLNKLGNMIYDALSTNGWRTTNN